MTHDTAPVLCTILKTARIIDKRSTVDIELKDTILELPRLWPLDTYFRLVPSPKQNAPLSCTLAVDMISTYTHPKGMYKHLIVKERLKLMRIGVCDSNTITLSSGEDIYAHLNRGGSFYGRWKSVIMVNRLG